MHDGKEKKEMCKVVLRGCIPIVFGEIFFQTMRKLIVACSSAFTLWKLHIYESCALDEGNNSKCH